MFDQVTMILKKTIELIQQTKESLKILSIFEKETVAKVGNYIKIPNAAERKRLTNQRILSSLQKIGVATHEEVEVLEAKIARLEIALQSKGRSSSQKAFVRPKSSELEN